MLNEHHHRENNELSELPILRYKEEEVSAFAETPMPHVIQIRQTGGPDVLHWIPIEVGESGGESGTPAKGGGGTELHRIAGRGELEASANELFEVVASRKVRINVNQRLSLEDTAPAHKAVEARATSGSTIPII